MFLRKIFFIIIFLILFIGSFVFYTNKAFLYSPETTHYNLTQEMIKLYNLAYEPDLTSRQIELILRGSVDEDIKPRPLFHLYDPIYNRAPYGTYTAKQWALENLQSSALMKFANLILNIFSAEEIKPHGDFSWLASVNYYAQRDLDKAYYGLGHILHLIEDMSVPAHSRNDDHLGGEPYEEWANINNGTIDFNLAGPLYNKGYRPVELYNIREYFDNLAKYSNRYFFSEGSIPPKDLSKDYISPIIVKERQEDYGLIGQRIYALGIDENGQFFRLAYKDIEETNWQKFINGTKSDEATVYIIDKYDQKLNTDYWNRLAPKAVMYGAGAIRLFMEETGLAYTVSYPEQHPPMHFPVAEDVVPPSPPPPSPPLPSKEIVQQSPQPEGKGEVKGETVERPQQQTGTIVTGPKTGGEGGMSWREVQGIDQEGVGGEQPQEPEPPQPPQPPSPPEIPPHLVINEIQIKDNEFVELYNPTDTAISLASYSFCYYSSNRDWDDPYRNKLFPETALISAGSYYLIGLKGYAQENGNPDADWQIYPSAQLSNSAGSIAIFPWDPEERTASEAETGVIDVVAWGEVGNVSEGISFQETISIDKSIQRKDNSQDTNNNNIDFEFRKIPTPTNSNGEQRIPGTFIPDDTIISEDTTWTIAGSPYYIESNAGEWPIVEEDITLTIEPGVIIMPMGGIFTFLEVRGTLIAEGTDTEKIVFTSIKDTDYGGVGSASAGDWANMIFTPTSKDSSFKNVIFRYGGDEGNLGIDTEMLKIDNTYIEMEDVIMENSETRGIHLINSNSEIKNSVFKDSKIGILIEGASDTSIIEDCLFENNSEFGIQIKDSASPVVKGNQFINNGEVTGATDQGAIMVYSAYPEFNNNQASNNIINGIFIHWKSRFEKDITWQADLPYILIANAGEYPTVASGSILTLEPGVVLKPYTGPVYTALLIEGTLLAQAASGSEIVFTSLKDDSFNGDTNNDGSATSPATGDWSHIKFTASSTGSILDHVFIYYSSTSPIIIESEAEVEIRDTVDYDPSP